jgi:YbbR domain-containing protein
MLKHWPIKIISVLIAACVWIFISVSGNKTDFFPGELTINTRNLPAEWAAIYDNYKARVKISASASTWAKLSADDFEVYLNLEDKGLGTYEIEPKVEVAQSGVKIVSVDPGNVTVRVEQATSAKLSVAVKFIGQPAPGFEVSSTKIEPQKVEAWGAKNILNKLVQATALVRLNGDDRDIDKKIELVALDDNDEEIPLIRFSPENVSLQVALARKGGGKVVGIKPKIIGSPATGFWMSEVKFSPEYVKVKGSEEILSNLDYIETKEINIENLKQSKKFNVDLNLNKKLSLVDRDSNEIEVEIKLSAISQARELQASFAYENLSENLKVSRLDPNLITVVVSGPPEILSSLNSENVIINLNLENRQPGTYSFNISKDNVSLPEGADLVSAVPSSVNVTIKAK